MIRYLYVIKGVVQGVGFRPFIYKLAHKHNLSGFVFNNSMGVTIELEGLSVNIGLFNKALENELPLLAQIDTFQKEQITLKNSTTFEIIQTQSNNDKTTLVPIDTKICKECLSEIDDKLNKKYYNYFATTCTNCGTRYSIIKTIPYDRANTSMDSFKMCKSCEGEYKNPLNRRYHAQPTSCKECGPSLELSVKGKVLSVGEDEIFPKISHFIKTKKIGAIKGVGGFHIVCDATNDEVLKRLREYKFRPTKPFAIMCKDIKQIESFAIVNEKSKELLTSNLAPIVILNTLVNSKISKYIAPNINRIGCFLPYTAIQYLLFKQLKNPIVATSANLGGEPIITTKDEIIEKLPFIDFILDFNRDIINACDDSLVQIVNNDIQLLRAARGFTPKVIKLAKKCNKKILAVGANQKNTISLVIEDNIIISPYIGDLDTIQSFEYFLRTVETFKRFYDFEPDLIVCDKHPNYETTKWAKSQNIKLLQIQHHIAHIYACKAEFSLTKKYLGFSFDGTGYGDDNTLWGGEVFIGDKRKYHFKPIKLLGSSKAIKEPRRVALSILFDRYSLNEVLDMNLDCVKSFSQNEIKILHQSYTKNLNAPFSSSIGRLFDGVASLYDILHFQEFEGEAGLICEQYYDKTQNNLFEYTIEDEIIDIKFDFFCEDIISLFINTLVKIIIDISLKEKMEVILSGGVFQNKTLLELVTNALEKQKIKYYYQKSTTINDGSISLGQAYYATIGLKS